MYPPEVRAILVGGQVIVGRSKDSGTSPAGTAYSYGGEGRYHFLIDCGATMWMPERPHLVQFAPDRDWHRKS